MDEYKIIESSSTSDVSFTGSDGSDSDPERALYDGDLSSSVLTKLSAYYLDDYNLLSPADYFVVRQGQYDYRLYYGDIDEDGTINDCQLVRYYSTGSYGSGYNVSIATLSGGSVDLSGYSGYVYSSYDSYLPSPDIVSGVNSIHARGSLLCLSVCLVACMLYTMIRRLFHA